MRTIEFMDVSLRDGHQSLWATRMPTAMMAPIARTIDRVGFQTIDLAGGSVFDACVMYLRENPWDRIRLMRRLVQQTPLNFITRGQNLCRFELFADDAIELTLKTVARNGMRSLKTFEPMNDMRSLAHTIRVAKDVGLYVIGCVIFVLSPIHTDDYFVQKTRELVAMGVDAVELKDVCALLTPDRVQALLPRLRAEIAGRAQLQLHGHCTSGYGHANYRAALESGADLFHTAVSPLADGPSLPPAEWMVAETRAMGYDVRIDDQALGEMARYFHWAIPRAGKPLGRPLPHDPKLYAHQVPGGMMTNLEYQLQEIGMFDRLPQVIEEIIQVRKELGYPIMVSPLSQYVAIQALFNVIHGERYKVVPVEIKKYALGWYGRPDAPIEPNVLDRIIGDEEPISERPGALIPPMVERFRAEHGPFDSDEDLILALFYSQNVLADYRAQVQPLLELPLPATPLELLVQEVAGQQNLAYCQVQKGRLTATWQF